MLVAACIMFQDDRQDCSFDSENIVVSMAKTYPSPANQQKIYSTGMKNPVN